MPINTYLFLCFNFKHNFLKITFKFIENKTIIDISIHILCINKLIFKYLQDTNNRNKQNTTNK